MKTSILLLFLVLFFPLISFSQEKAMPVMDAIFCGKPGVSGKEGGNYTLAELKECDFKISAANHGFTVVEFKLSLVSKDKSFAYTEKQIKGNVIPEEYRGQILTHTKYVYLEYIRAVDTKGTYVTLKPVSVRIQ